MKDSRGESQRWVLQARNDLDFVEWLLREERFFDKGCFMAQQASEKALKACLYASGERFVPGHSLVDLAKRLVSGDSRFGEVLDACRRLDRFYIPTRYPNGLPGDTPHEHYTLKDLRAALDDANQIWKLVEVVLGEHKIEL